MHYEIIVNAALEAAILVTQVTSVNDNMIIGDVGGMRKDEERSDVYNDFHLKGGLCAPLGGCFAACYLIQEEIPTSFDATDVVRRL